MLKIFALSKSEVLFVGDKLEPGGNDYPATKIGIDTFAVKNPTETEALIVGR
jgi:hypothetical protein